MRDFLIDLILMAVLALFIMQIYRTTQNQQYTLDKISDSLQTIDSRLSQFEVTD